jgi:hypothetical protein
MQKDLFGIDIIQESTCVRTLKEYDQETFEERRKRCEFLFSLVPTERVWISSDESYYMWLEIRLAYISGCYISTILLAQSFIERKFQADYHMMLDFKKSKLTLDQILKEMKKDKSMDPYWIARIDAIRKKRNPLVHFKDVMKDESMARRSNHDQDKGIELLKQDAKEAIEIMYAVSRMHLKGPAKF